MVEGDEEVDLKASLVEVMLTQRARVKTKDF
jgi:hypothetical protein